MADVYEKNLGSKSSLTTSDYIRVVGSDNVSYKQLVSDVADKILTLGKSASTTGTISDLDAITPFTTGYATFTASASPTGAQGAFWYSLIGWGTGARVEITCIDVSGTVYTKVKDYSGWKAWVKQPTRDEIDALTSNFSGTSFINKTISAATTITLSAGFRGTLTITDSNNAHGGFYLLHTTGSGAVGYKAVSSASNITIDISNTYALTLTPSSGTRVILIQVLAGTASIS